MTPALRGSLVSGVVSLPAAAAVPDWCLVWRFSAAVSGSAIKALRFSQWCGVGAEVGVARSRDRVGVGVDQIASTSTPERFV